MPAMPQPFRMKDWKAHARAYDAFVFNFNARGEYLPLIWWDDSRVNVERRTFGLPSYVGSAREGTAHEAINCLAALLGATLVGIDKSRGSENWVLMAEAYFNSANGLNLVLNGVRSGTGGSFWYEVYPHILFYGLADRYPGVGRLDEILKITADRWHEACLAMGCREGKPDFNHTAFNFATLKPVDNGKWKEPDAAAGIGWLEYMAWVRLKDPRYLQAAECCMRFLQERKANPHYEVLLPAGAYLAARMKAELGRDYDVEKLVNWCFEPSDARPGWGIIVGRWGDRDTSGLAGSITDGGGFAFTMNTFAEAGLLVPLVRYDDRYARAIGKWILNLANAARLFYPGEHPPDRQSCPGWKGDPQGLLAYEGLRKEGIEYALRTPRLKDQRKDGKLPPDLEQQWKKMQPFALGDPSQYGWNSPTDFGVYGSSHVGFLAAMVERTNVEMILQLDLLATEFFRPRAYPTFLYYNAYPEKKIVEIDLGPEPRDLYDAAADAFVLKAVAGKASFPVEPDRARVLVVVPAGGKLTRDGARTLIDGVVADYMSGH